MQEEKKLYNPLQEKFQKILTPFEHFIHNETSTGLVLMVMTVLALVLANSPWEEGYKAFFHTEIGFSFGSWKVYHSLHHWINDGLMAIFFFVVGLEIKREILIGELSQIKQAILPILAAIGGMVVPALIYASFNYDGIGKDGWGIPMATDIAFAISALVLLGKRVPPSLVTFLVALAIVDDLGAVLVIALFYTNDLNLMALGISLGIFVVMLFLNRLDIRNMFVYFVLAIAMWFFMLDSGIHATIAGVLAAIAIPSKAKLNPLEFTKDLRGLLDEFDRYPIATDMTMHERQKAILQNIKDRIDAVTSPSARLEHALHLPVSLLIIPFFALANAGINIEFASVHHLLQTPIALGVIFGLIGGKVIGIAGTAYIASKFNIAQLPQGSTMKQVVGVAFLGGIGFTMSIFISDLAFYGNEDLVIQAKAGILVASLLAGIIGYTILKINGNQLQH
ncbi:MAG: Na+/H+ antiporter NhaA [Epsilonproteobacteria bacterium]|nr:Na+/H+ antiporter NhaA [Campylobacterota bacterium]